MEPVGGGATGARTRLRNQMRRLFNAYVRLIHEHEHGEQFTSSAIANRGEFWWNERKPDELVLFDSKIRLGEDFFNEITNHPVPLDMNTLKMLKRCSLGLDLYLWLTYPDLHAQAPAPAHVAAPAPVRNGPRQVRATNSSFGTSAKMFSGS